MILYGAPKNQLTRKIQRHASERGLDIQFRDVTSQAPKEGELQNLANGLGGWQELLDPQSKAWKALGMAYREYDAREELLANPDLLYIPLLREGNKVWKVSEATDLTIILAKK